MTRLATIGVRAVHQPFTKAIWDQLKANLDYAFVGGGDLASAATLHVTSRVHRVTGSTTIDNITDDLGATLGQAVTLIFQATTTVCHNGGGTGNIRLLGSLHAGFVAGETLTLIYDGTNWVENHRSPKHLCGEEVVVAHAAIAGGGYLPEDGSAISRTTFAALFAHLGTTHGSGDGSTTFNLPDKRGRVTVGHAASGGHADVSTVGANDGVGVAFRRPKHRHTINAAAKNHTHTVTLPSGTQAGASAGAVNAQTLTTSVESGGTPATVGADPANDPLDAPAYIVKPTYIRI